MGNNYKYKFSIVVPIYNVEEYLEETILSVINQTIGFEQNVQLILVNDGSPDNSDEICKKYLEKYPENIIYIEQENGGVSSARNNGMNYIEGKYVNFLDSDDKWPVNAFSKVWNYFEKYKSRIDVVACRLKYFEAASGYGHPLNFKFNKDRIIYTEYDYSHIQMHMASCFIKSSKLKDLKFCTDLKFGEDSLFINKLILQKQRYGALKSVDYLYRKRANETSAIDTCQQKPDFYDKTLTYFHDEIIEFAKDKFNELPYYVQYLVMYDCQWRVKRPIPEGVLTDEEADSYKAHLKRVLKNIDNFIIMEQKNIYAEHKVFALNLKHDYDIRKVLSQKQNELFYKNIKIINTKCSSIMKIDEISIKEYGVMHLEGFINTFLDREDYNIYFEDEEGNQYFIKDMVDYSKKKKLCLYGDYYYEQYFKIDIPISDNSFKIKAKFQYKNNFARNMDFVFTNNCNYNRNLKNSYYRDNGFLIYYRDKDCQLCFKKETKKEWKAFEKNVIKEIWKTKSKKLALYRIACFIISQFIKKEIWLISDRPDKAGDNGEAFFKYMMENKHDNIDAYFVIKKDSEDYEKMKKIGKIIEYGSKKYKLFMLLAKHVVSSQASDYVINPFGNQKKFMYDLYKFKFTFLQHGIIKDDLSDWLNKASKKIDCFVTSGKPEYQSLIDGDYYYGEEVVKLTGLPRHDYLIQRKDEKKKKILIIPTWRKSIKGCVDPKTDTSIYCKDFKESDFFKFYNTLINNEKLIECMKKNGYEGLFCLHPLFAKQSVDFEANDIFKVNDGYVDYQTEFAEGSLLITDYSSVFFDFGYLRKPVVYTHFDKEAFFEGHSYSEGYFSYEDNGFGPVCYNLEDTAKQIIKIIENNCELKEEYLERINDFYIEADGKNSERLFNFIIEM